MTQAPLRGADCRPWCWTQGTDQIRAEIHGKGLVGAAKLAADQPARWSPALRELEREPDVEFNDQGALPVRLSRCGAALYRAGRTRRRPPGRSRSGRRT